MNRRTVVLATALVLVPLAACGDDDDASTSPDRTSATTTTSEATTMNLVRVPATEAAALLDAPPADLVVLDVRTPEEFSEGHLERAVLLDFYRSDFADELAALDRGVPYLLYCRSGNRSGQALEMMRQLGFEDVTEVEGGVISWAQEGLPLVTG